MYYIVPPHNGVFRIRLVSGPSGNSYWQFMPGQNSGIELKAYDETNTRQMFAINKNTDGSYRMKAVYDLTDLTMYKDGNRYWGHGYVCGGNAANWTFQVRTAGGSTFSKIFCTGNPEPLDSYAGQYVHFYTDTDNGEPNQRWVLENVATKLWYGKSIDSGSPSTNPSNNNNGGQSPNANGGAPPSSSGISTDPSLSIFDDDGNELSKANGNLNRDTVYILNNSKGNIKVHVGNASGASAPGELNDVVLQAGEFQFWLRKNGTPETITVYRGDGSGNFSNPQTYSASPGQITAVI